MGEYLIIYMFIFFSIFFMLLGVVYGFRILRLIQYNSLWTGAWVLFILLLVSISLGECMVYLFDFNVLYFKHFVILGVSICAFGFSYFIYRFFKKYLNNFNNIQRK